MSLMFWVFGKAFRWCWAQDSCLIWSRANTFCCAKNQLLGFSPRGKDHFLFLFLGFVSLRIMVSAPLTQKADLRIKWRDLWEVKVSVNLFFLWSTVSSTVLGEWRLAPWWKLTLWKGARKAVVFSYGGFGVHAQWSRAQIWVKAIRPIRKSIAQI